MWMYVLFDLPVTTKKEQREATKFREHLLDLGFEMVQFSVYGKSCAGKDKVESLANKISVNLPAGGTVDIMSITDKQYENIMRFHGRSPPKGMKKDEQFILF